MGRATERIPYVVPAGTVDVVALTTARQSASAPDPMGKAKSGAQEVVGKDPGSPPALAGDPGSTAGVEAAPVIAKKAALSEDASPEVTKPDANADGVSNPANIATIVVAKAPGKDGSMELLTAAEVLRRVTRTRQVVSLVSQVIIRSYEEEALLAEACRHLVAYGGYLMAWIGVAEEKPERIIRPVAHAGLEANFLQALKISWSNDLANRSPTSRAVQEQRPHIARNIIKEPRYAVLRQEARLHGYTATCALPLQFGQYGLGVMTVHAAEPDAFAAEEVSLLRELANDVASGIVSLRDRARRENLEEEAMKLQAQFSSIVDNAREGIFQATPEGQLILVNNALVRLLGYDSKEELLAVLPPVILTHLHPDYVKPAQEGMFVADGAEPFEARMRKKSGSWVWVGIIAKRVEGPDGPIVEGFVQDTTARHGEAQASARLAAVVDAADDAIIGTDLAGIVTDWNAGATRLFGFERSEAVGRPMIEIIVPREGQEEALRVRRAIARGERVPRFEALRVCKVGEPIHVSIMVTPIFARDGEIIGATAVEHDITAARAAEVRKRSAQLELADAARLKILEEARRTFVSAASHELNTPLTPLRIHVEALAERPDVTTEQRNHLVVIERNVLRLANLVKDMLEASRLETGRFKLEMTDVPVPALLRETVESLAEQAAAAGLTLETGAVARVVVEVDRSRVSQVLYNLVTNAINFTPKGGRITVSADLEGKQAMVRVTDTGLGLSSEQIGQLFQPFSRPHEGNGMAQKGTGLGLFISKGIIEQHGGQIWAESDGPGKGATFAFSLPVPKISIDAPLPPEPAEGNRRVRLRKQAGGRPATTKRRDAPVQEQAEP